ncbi:N-(5'-phosphoribosyl)anthranilate isomerase [Marinivivus vitaminiproducens]|uniref:phosphoribosylanthranilate isomerase n=1 Tax=Marinivivus vitaminiproducens TaxID=3035935 RepID=UPI00279F9FDD|nr:hypothetical protein P4R82_11645 [Geminicoccaceae bacterium SCSIO 64248]
MLLKICGIREPRELIALQASLVDFAGLWHGIANGHAELDRDAFADLSAQARGLGIAPVLVTFLADLDELSVAIEAGGIEHVQLHGFQPPSLLSALRRRFGSSLRLIKVLHVQLGRCLETPLVPAYERAGTDLFLLDSVAGDGRIGSTGQALGQAAVFRAASALSRPFLLAGGLDAGAAAAWTDLRGRKGFLGIDVDSAARNAGGRICPDRVASIHQAWRSHSGSMTHAA